MMRCLTPRFSVFVMADPDLAARKSRRSNLWSLMQCLISCRQRTSYQQEAAERKSINNLWARALRSREATLLPERG